MTSPKASPKTSPKKKQDCEHKTKQQLALEANPLHFRRNEFVAVRNEMGSIFNVLLLFPAYVNIAYKKCTCLCVIVADGFYLCRLCQNIYENTKRTKIQWLNEREDEPGVYDVEWVDFLNDDYSAIICYVRMFKVELVDFRITQSHHVVLMLLRKRVFCS